MPVSFERGNTLTSAFLCRNGVEKNLKIMKNYKQHSIFHAAYHSTVFWSRKFCHIMQETTCLISFHTQLPNKWKILCTQKGTSSVIKIFCVYFHHYKFLLILQWNKTFDILINSKLNKSDKFSTCSWAFFVFYLPVSVSFLQIKLTSTVEIIAPHLCMEKISIKYQRNNKKLFHHLTKNYFNQTKITFFLCFPYTIKLFFPIFMLFYDVLKTLNW